MNDPSKTSAPLRPYDESMNEHFSMYDHMIYRMDAEVCTKESICLISGNIIKYYRYVAEIPYELDNQDDVIAKKLALYVNQQQANASTDLSSPQFQEELTDEQLKNLIEDSNNE